MDVRRIAALIKDAGLSRQKAPRLKRIAQQLERDFGRVTLRPLHKADDAQVESYLTSLPGVGTKTAKCVMMYSMGRDVLPVDTHVARVARRLRLVEPRDKSDLHEHLEKVVRPKDRYAFHVGAVMLGRSVCKAVHPRCGGCSLRAICPGRL